MEDILGEFLKAIGAAQQQLGKAPDFMVKAEKDKVKIALQSKSEPLVTFGDWAFVTVSPRDFINMVQNFQTILTDLQKQPK